MNLGYQSSSTYLTLPDTLKTSFPCSNGSHLSVKNAPARDFHAFIADIVEEFEQVDTQIWPIHLRWRVINACLAEGLLTLAEVPDGYVLEVPAESEDVKHMPEMASDAI